MEFIAIGTAILTITIFIELALAAYSLVTKSHQEKTRSVLHFAIFAVFLLLLLTSVIEWGFRWFGFAALLFYWAVLGIYQLFHMKENEEYQARRMIRRFGSASLLALLAISPILLFPPHDALPPGGPYTVSTLRETYTDPSRIEQFTSSGDNRKINASFWYPRNNGRNETYPLVVFSHGGLGTENSNVSLYQELASHGYVVCSIGHPYHAFWTKTQDGQTTFVSREYFGEILREDAGRDKRQSFQYYQKWLDTRTADIHFVIDTILAKAADGADGVYGMVDGTRIGVMGHSLGGSAALAIPRQRDDISAVIALESPFLADIVGVENGEFVWTDERYPVPVLNIYSDSSWMHLTEWPQYAENAALLSAAPEDAISLHLSGAGHFSLTDLALANPLLTMLLEGGQNNPDRAGYLLEENQACLKFFDHHIKTAIYLEENR